MRILIVLVALFITDNTFACECIVRPLLERIQNAEFIAKAKVIKISAPTVDGLYQDAQIEVLELYKGKKINSIKVYANLQTSCNLIVQENTTWLIIARVDKTGNLQFDLCSGSIQLDGDHHSREYPNAEANWNKHISRKLSVLSYLHTQKIENPNEYHLFLQKIVNADEEFRGYEVGGDKFAVFEFTIEKNLDISNVRALKEFDNKGLSDSLLNYLRVNKKVDTRNISGIIKRSKMVIVYYFYEKDDKYQSFISQNDL